VDKKAALIMNVPHRVGHSMGNNQCRFFCPSRDPNSINQYGQVLTLHRITNAFEQRMFEIELEKMSDGTFDPAQPNGDNVWNDSIRILKAARKKLVGF